MSFSFITSLCESKLFPSEQSLRKLDTQETAELAYLSFLSLTILRAEDDTDHLARAYCRKTLNGANFTHWSSNGTDLSCLLYSLVTGQEKDVDEVHSPIRLVPGTIVAWLRAQSSGQEQDESRNSRFLINLDSMLKIRNPSMRAIRRLVQDWPELSLRERKLALTRLLQFMRARAGRGEILPMLNRLSRMHALEIDGACNLENGEDCGDDDRYISAHKSTPPSKPKMMSFLAGLTGALVGAGVGHMLRKESATGGATGAANVATVAGGIGAGFDPNGDRGIYADAKSMIIRRAGPGPVAKKRVIKPLKKS